MTGFWLVSFIVLWLVVLAGAVVILALAREIESLHARLEAVEKGKHRPETIVDSVPSMSMPQSSPRS